MRPEIELESPLTNPGDNRTNYLNVDCGIKSWLLTRDHKRIALLYLISLSFFFVIGGASFFNHLLGEALIDLPPLRG